MVSVARWGSARSPSAAALLGAPAWRARLLVAGDLRICRRGGRPPRGGATREDSEAGTQGQARLAASASAGDEDGCGKVVLLEREGARRARSSAEAPPLRGGRALRRSTR